MADIFDKIAARDNAPKPRKLKKVVRYVITWTPAAKPFGGNACERKTSRKIYERALALKLVKRLNRLNPEADAYADPINVTITV